jgi:hypothetical protein
MKAPKKRRDVLFCIVCRTNEISTERIYKGAVTCSKECAGRLPSIRRRLVDRVKCRYCGVPATSEERKSYKKWRESIGERKRPGRPKNPPKLLEAQTETTEMMHVQ